jgi:peptidoglycan/LPS O-acetylase OafA/YrhL
LRSFYVRRVLRIVPLYYLILFFFGVVLAGLFPGGHGFGKTWLPHPVSHVFFMSNISYVMDGLMPRSPLAITWSVAVEEHFYLLWPTLLFLLKPRRLLGLCVAVGLLAIVVRLYMVQIGMDETQIMMFTFSRMDSFATGAALLLVWRSPTRWQRFRRCFLPAMLAAFGLALVCQVGLKVGFWIDGCIALLYTGSNLGYAALIGVVLHRERFLGGIFLTCWLRSFGRYSYAIYLTNLGIAFGWTLLLGEPGYWLGGFGIPLFFALVIGSSWVVGWLLYHLVEVRFLQLKRFFPYDRQEALAAEAADKGLGGFRPSKSPPA